MIMFYYFKKNIFEIGQNDFIWSGQRSVPVTGDDADCYMVELTN